MKTKIYLIKIFYSYFCNVCFQRASLFVTFVKKLVAEVTEQLNYLPGTKIQKKRTKTRCFHFWPKILPSMATISGCTFKEYITSSMHQVALLTGFLVFCRGRLLIGEVYLVCFPSTILPSWTT